MAAIFFDIDGTLVDREKKLIPSAAEGIRLAKENGHQVYVNSGRTLGYIFDPQIVNIPFDGLLCGCGTHIILHGEDVLYHPVPKDLMKRTVELFYELDMPAIIEGREHLFMDRDMICRDPYGEMLFRTIHEVIRPIRDNEENWEGSKFSAVVMGKAIEDVLPLFEQDFEVSVHDGYAMELVPKGFSKATAIQKVCELTGVDRKDTYCFGDGANDVEMLKYAEYGIVMGNGKPVAKEIADYITDDIHDDGVFNGLRHFGLI